MKKWSKQLLSGCLLAALLLSMGGCQQGSTPSSTASSVVSSAASGGETGESTAQPGKTYSDMPVQTLDLDASDPEYYPKALETEIYNYKLIRNVPTAYTTDSWEAYTSTANTLLNIDPASLDDVSRSMIDNAVAKREALVQVAPAADCMWYIWGDAPAVAEEVEDADFALESYDNADMKPFLVPYLVEDQSTAKGNMIVVAGGGYSSRGNAMEGYPIAEAFRDLGYNAYVLQRRVEPYSEKDVWLDMQRAVRLVKYYSDQWGIDLENSLLAVSGYSGSGGNIRTMLEKFYGSITPDQFDPDYVCDAVDAVNSDVDVAHLIYSGAPIETENPNLPHMFIAVGADDSWEGSLGLFEQAYELGLDPELHVYGLNGHGFGAGMEGTSSMTWMEACDLYMQKVMGYAEIPFTGEIPAEYTLTQQVHVNWFPIGDDVTVNVYTTADGGKCLFTFYGWGENIMVEGLLIGGRVASVTYDSAGYFGQDAAKMWELVDPAAWVPVN